MDWRELHGNGPPLFNPPFSPFFPHMTTIRIRTPPAHDVMGPYSAGFEIPGIIILPGLPDASLCLCLILHFNTSARFNNPPCQTAQREDPTPPKTRKRLCTKACPTTKRRSRPTPNGSRMPTTTSMRTGCPGSRTNIWLGSVPITRLPMQPRFVTPSSTFPTAVVHCPHSTCLALIQRGFS